MAGESAPASAVEQITAAIGGAQTLLSSYILLPLLLGVGLYLTISLRLMPIRRIPFAFGKLLEGRKAKDGDEGDVSPFGALMTALSATIGTGNIGGVAVALLLGGPGALFWMWVTALIGMASKFSEAVLAVKFREVDADGRHVGGPMYYIKNGMGPRWGWLAATFAFAGVFTSFVTGNLIQSSSVASVLDATLEIPPWATGLLLAGGAGAVILGGVKRIANVASALVPSMAVIYILSGLIIILMNLPAVPGVFSLIVTEAFNFEAAGGAAFWLALRHGVARGVFSNEAGQGSAAIAHAAAKTKSPVDQGIVAMLGTFIDTICVCTITGIVILLTLGVPGSDALVGAPLTSQAFNTGLPGEFGQYIVAFGLVLFAFTTILGWSYYGERCAEYLLGEGAVQPFRYVWVGIVFVGACTLMLQETGVDNIVQLIWLMGDVMTALMTTPNLIALAALSPLVFKLAREYFADTAEK